jgi:serine/threonine protein phosphatase 1
LPPEHIHFLEGLPYFARIGGYLFVHAGFRPGVPLAMQRREDMLWIRNEFLDIRCDFGGAVVYGHTPSPEPVNRSNRIGIDTGAYATGNLTLAMFEGGERRFYAVTDDEVRPWY